MCRCLVARFRAPERTLGEALAATSAGMAARRPPATSAGAAAAAVPEDRPIVATFSEIATYAPEWLARRLVSRELQPQAPAPEEVGVDLKTLTGEAREAEIARREAKVRAACCCYIMS
eukprot:SAG22_NODE_73_length_22318_cov_47.105315_19_plen_118_part_00